MQTSDNMSTAHDTHDVHFDDTVATTRGHSNYYFSFATWPMEVGTPPKDGKPWIRANKSFLFKQKKKNNLTLTS